MNEEDLKQLNANYTEMCEKLKVPDSCSLEDVAAAMRINSKAIWGCGANNMKLFSEFIKRGL